MTTNAAYEIFAQKLLFQWLLSFFRSLSCVVGFFRDVIETKKTLNLSRDRNPGKSDGCQVDGAPEWIQTRKQEKDSAAGIRTGCLKATTFNTFLDSLL